jgi:Domain of unknown function (DUF4129)
VSVFSLLQRILASTIIRAVLSVILLTMITPRTTYAQNAPDPQTYATWVRETLAAARRGDQIGLEETAARLIATTEVQLSDGSTVAVNNDWLRTELARQPPNTTLITARLGALADALAQPSSNAPADALERLRTILSNPPYGQPDSPPATPPPAWLSDLLNFFVRILEALLRPIGVASAGSGSMLAWILAGIGGFAIIGVILYLARGLWRARTIAVPPDTDPEAHLTSIQAIDQAGTLARSGDYRTGVRFLYLAALLRLDERGLLRYDRALTNREYLDRLRENPRLQAALAQVVETFDRVWYGYAPLDQAAFDAYRAGVERLGRDS